MVEEVVRGVRMIGIFAPRAEAATPPATAAPFFEQVSSIGTLAMVLRMLKIPDGSLRLLVHGMRRVNIAEPLGETPWPRARIEILNEIAYDDDEIKAMKLNARDLLTRIVEQSNQLPNDLIVAANNTEDAGRLADLIASNLQLSLAEQQQVLELVDTKQRMLRVQEIMNRELEIARLGSKIQSQVKSNMDRVQREYFLREQMKAIRRELGEGEETGEELDELAAQIKQAKMPAGPLKVAQKELARLRSMSPQSAEYTVARTYLDWLLMVPWSKSSRDNIDLKRARIVLDEDHYDLEKIKERILEYLAVIKLRKAIRGPLMCLVGPPGVGKTSLGRSVARAMGRKFIRLSLGGVRDEAEIRGHRRTYIGSMPGRIIKAMRDAETNNPVCMLDEIDKLGSDYRGDPSSALLEVLDPEQNSTFTDHYLDVPFDLSNVMFITTANSLETIPGPLLDRMEVIRIAGYTLAEKVHIARQYLIPRALGNTGLKPRQVTFADAALEHIIEDYTREAGLRNLEREITNLCRKVARDVAEGRKGRVVIDPERVRKGLGPARFERDDLHDRTSEPGVALGLAWTPVGGDTLFIEATATPGQGRMTLTGQLGDVMKESAQAARTWLQSAGRQLRIPEKSFLKQDIHIHVPAGAIPKDGPSAGITMLTALASLLKGIPIRDRLAMTGEITIKGAVLPVGGIKEKVLAAHRGGIRTIILPQRNAKDLEDVPEEVRREISFHFVRHAGEVLPLALAQPAARRRTPAARRPARARKTAVKSHKSNGAHTKPRRP
jgi:ATP-dependent Lon protease